MTAISVGMDERLRGYVQDMGMREHPSLAALRAETARLPEGGMQSSPEQMQLMTLLIELMGARRVLEIGCFTGYGSLAMALALPPGGRVVTLDVNDGWTSIGRRYWREAGVADKVELRLGLAQTSLEALAGGPPFDLAYIDADKKSYDLYLDHALELVRPGGLIALDNMLWKGAVADPADHSRQTESLRHVARRIRDDPALTPCLVPIGDGVMLARRR